MNLSLVDSKIYDENICMYAETGRAYDRRIEKIDTNRNKIDQQPILDKKW